MCTQVTRHWRSITCIGLTVVLLSGCNRAPAPDAASIPAPPDVAAPSAGSLKTTSGLSTRVLQAGSGQRHPRATDRVTVHYTGWSTDGTMFDSSVARGEPSTFRLDEVIPGWTEGVQMMVEGEKRRFWIPARLAYEGVPSKPQGMLVFDIELIKIG
jgi:peptidylprolyl isomerase